MRRRDGRRGCLADDAGFQHRRGCVRGRRRGGLSRHPCVLSNRVMNRGGEEKLMSDKFTVGGDASAMAGPVGRSTTAQTDAMMKAEILSWSRSRGVFAGVSLEGATLRPDNDDNGKVYGHAVSQREVLEGRVEAPHAAAQLFEELNRWAPFKN